MINIHFNLNSFDDMGHKNPFMKWEVKCSNLCGNGQFDDYVISYVFVFRIDSLENSKIKFDCSILISLYV